jgi:hypothetical protein
LALVLTAPVLAATGRAGEQAVRWFHSPSGNIECEVAFADPRGAYAYCQTFSPLQTATLRRNGRTAVCSSRACPVGNGPEGSPALAYGRSIRVGLFRCSSSRSGIRCVVVTSGHGFTISREGIRTFKNASSGETITVARPAPFRKRSAQGSDVDDPAAK